MATLNELGRSANIACLNIFNNYSPKEYERLTTVIKFAWSIGKEIKERQDYLDTQESRLDPGVHKE